ncbi:FtsX-like permease family protein [Kribbella deserti]|uniref:FtsX-like permease family protein n=1 Tax=Kribbella deserti TaxID=1926257 RepID=A0ABV6QDL9_9ACTN
MLIGTCAAFAPWFARSVEQTVVTEMLTVQRLPAAWYLEGRPAPSTVGAQRAPTPEQLTELIPSDAAAMLEAPVHGYKTDIGWEPTAGGLGALGRLAWRDNFCAHLEFTKGRCPKAPNEVALSTTDVRNYRAKPGMTLKATPTKYSGGGRLTVVGIYRPKNELEPYWFGVTPTGRSVVREDKPSQSDFLLTDRSTFDSTPSWGQFSTVDTAPIPGKVRVDDLALLKAVSTSFESAGAVKNQEVGNFTSFPGLVDSLSAERRQATTIIPLVMVQVALFGVVVLALALSAVVDQRRPELAISRLRGLRQRQTGWLLAVELAGPVLAGMLAGLLVGFGLTLVVQETWLDGGAPLEFPWTVAAALVAAAIAGLAVVFWTVQAVVRQPISTLLRRVVPRRRGRTLGAIDLSVIVLATAGLVAALTGDGRGPLPILTPTLLALAVGLAFAHLLLPLAGVVSRRSMNSGRLGLALGALQVARRPAVTRIVAIVAVASALVSFAGQAAFVADDNRDLRAGYETGAEAVLTLGVPDLPKLDKALATVDPERKWVTPVLLGIPASHNALTTMMVELDSFRRIAYRGDRITDEAGFQQVRAPADNGVQVKGSRLRIIATPSQMSTVPLPTNDGTPPPPLEQAEPLHIEAVIVAADGGRYIMRMGPVPLRAGKPVQVSAPMDCKQGCRLLRLGIARQLGDVAGLQGEVAITNVSTDVQPKVDLGATEDWQPMRGTIQEEVIEPRAEPGGLILGFTNHGNAIAVQHASVPVIMPALVTPDFPFSEGSTAPGLDGFAMPLQSVQPQLAPVPRLLRSTAVVDLANVRRLGGSPDPSVLSSYLWLNAEGVAHLDEILTGLRAAGLTPAVSDRLDDRTAAYARSASALALQLTPVVGIAGWSLAIIVLLLMVVTSWRSRAQDYASLRIAGVPAAVTGRAARWEQTGPVAIAVLLGSVCGVVGAKIALPLIPLFAETTTPSPVPLDLGLNGGVAIGLWLIGTLVLTVTTLLLGTAVSRRATYPRIREEL